MDLMRNCIFLALISMLMIYSVDGQVYRCSKSDEKCVFPFEEDGETYNECKGGWGGHWCHTDGSHGWAYCDICPEDLTSTTTTTSTTTASTTKSPTTTPTTVSTTTTKASTTTSTTISTTTTVPSTTTTIPSTTTTISSTSTTSTSASTQTDALKLAGGLESISEGDQSTESPEIEDGNVAATEQELPVDDDDSTTQGSAENDKSSTTEEIAEDKVINDESLMDIQLQATTVQELLTYDEDSSTQGYVESSTTGQIEERKVIGDILEISEDTKTDDVSTTTVVTKAPAKACTYRGNTCKFPFEYEGVVYNECVGHVMKRFGWCYIDDKQEEYDDCYPCKEETTSTSTTTKSTLASTSSVAVPKGRAPESKEDVPTTENQITTTTDSEEQPLSSPETEKSSTSKETTTKNGVQGVSGEATAEAVRDGQETSEPTEEDLSGPGTVAIIVVVLSILALLVILGLIVLYVRKLRRSKNADDTEKNGNVGESGEGLLSHNKNGNHKAVNDGNSQEMQPLKKQNGDCDVINEKMNGTTTVIA
uniref:location of vulva defective 1-like isoform X3 n=1 Tax=Styela clava TaxID=7725 RepID=UPI00193A3BA9|nr:location of vulva defective 1-like isoform X3 [Styela clava]